MTATKPFSHFFRSISLALVAWAFTAVAAAPPASAQEGTGASYRPDVAALASTYAPWTDTRIPFSLSLKSPASIRLSGTATMVNGQSISLSIRMLGFEVASAYIDNDSIIATYKLKKRYVAESIPDLLHGFPATVGNLQSLLLGRLFYPGDDRAVDEEISRFDIRAAEDADLPDALIVSPAGLNLDGVVCAFVTDGATVPAMLATILMAGNSEASFLYSTPVSTEGGAVASSFDLDGMAGTRKVSASFNWNLDRARWNSGITLSRPSTAGYTRIPASSLLKAISSL